MAGIGDVVRRRADATPFPFGIDGALSRLAGKVALVTGAARGLGGSIAREIAAEGGRVMLTDLHEEMAGHSRQAW